MLKTGKQNFALCATKQNKYSNSRVVGKKISERKKNPIVYRQTKANMLTLMPHETILVTLVNQK
jgi:hypothetical protein